MELYGGGDLSSFVLRRLKQTSLLSQSAWSMLAMVPLRLFEALSTLHSRGVFHKELHKENILFFHQWNPYSLRLGKMGVSSVGLLGKNGWHRHLWLRQNAGHG
mmetsp:Transcript_5052/g.10093  ORF Transcript_5052/g.10093 Transcript_5052/m.10093 type:complete len:103 (-) Transcript_5052:655-963(-)